MVVDSIKENTRIGIAVRGKVLHIGPVSPAKSSIGAKTTMVVKIPKKTGLRNQSRKRLVGCFFGFDFLKIS